MFINYEIKILPSILEMPGLKEFIIQNHYSKSLARGSRNYVLLVGGEIKACIQFGIPTGRNCSKYGDKVLELKRMVIDDSCPTNTGSWFISKCLKDIKANTEYTDILSYADPQFGHQGIVYKASNFIYIGKQRQAQAIRYGKKNYHIRICYQKKNGKETKTAKLMKHLLRLGKAKYVQLKPKNIFVFPFDNSKREKVG